MAISITLTSIKKISLGSVSGATATLSFIGDGSTAYTDNGVTMPTGWKSALGLQSKVLWVGINGPLTIDSAHNVGLLAKVDIDSNKLVLFGTEPTTLGDEIKELAATYVPANSTYTAEIFAIGN